MRKIVLDLEPLAEQVKEWMQTRQVKGDSLGTISQNDKLGITLFGTTNMICIRYIFNMLHFNDKEKDLWADAINRYQNNKTGIYESPFKGKIKQYFSTGVALGALKLIERKPKHLLLHHHELISDWNILKPWLEANSYFSISSFISALVAEGRTPMTKLHQIVDWLDEKQNPDTGYWMRAHARDPMCTNMRLAYHLYAFVYENLQRPIHYANAIIDKTLSLLKNDEFYDDSTEDVAEDRIASERPGVIKGWINMDGLYTLARISRVAQHRRSEVIEVSEKLADAVLPKFADSIQFSKNLWETNWALGCISILPILQELIPHRLKGRQLKCVQDVHGIFI